MLQHWQVSEHRSQMQHAWLKKIQWPGSEHNLPSLQGFHGHCLIQVYSSSPLNTWQCSREHCHLGLSGAAVSQTGRQFCVAYLTDESNVGVCDEHLVIWLVRAPHEVRYEQCRAAGHSLRTMNEHLAPFAHCFLRHQHLAVVHT